MEKGTTTIATAPGSKCLPMWEMFMCARFVWKNTIAGHLEAQYCMHGASTTWCTPVADTMIRCIQVMNLEWLNHAKSANVSRCKCRWLNFDYERAWAFETYSCGNQVYTREWLVFLCWKRRYQKKKMVWNLAKYTPGGSAWHAFLHMFRQRTFNELTSESPFWDQDSWPDLAS